MILQLTCCFFLILPFVDKSALRKLVAAAKSKEGRKIHLKEANAKLGPSADKDNCSEESDDGGNNNTCSDGDQSGDEGTDNDPLLGNRSDGTESEEDAVISVIEDLQKNGMLNDPSVEEAASQDNTALLTQQPPGEESSVPPATMRSFNRDRVNATSDSMNDDRTKAMNEKALQGRAPLAALTNKDSGTGEGQVIQKRKKGNGGGDGGANKKVREKGSCGEWTNTNICDEIAAELQISQTVFCMILTISLMTQNPEEKRN